MIVVIDDRFVEFLAQREQQLCIADAEKGFGWAMMLFQGLHEYFQAILSSRPKRIKTDWSSAPLKMNFFEHEDGKKKHDTDSELREERKSFDNEWFRIEISDEA